MLYLEHENKALTSHLEYLVVTVKRWFYVFIQVKIVTLYKHIGYGYEMQKTYWTRVAAGLTGLDILLSKEELQ